MLSQIASALSSGFSQKQILDYIIKKFPKQSKKIQQALTAGFSIDQILAYLGAGTQEEFRNLGGTEHEQAREMDIQRAQNINKKALGAAALGAGALAVPMAATALQRAIPSSLSGLLPNLLQQQAPTTPPITPGISSGNIQTQPLAPQPPVPPTIPQPAQTEQLTPSLKPEYINNILEKHTNKELLDSLAEKYNPEQIDAYFSKFLKKDRAKIEKLTGQPFKDLVASYLSSKPGQPEANELLPTPTESVEAGEQEEKAPKEKIKNLSFVNELIGSSRDQKDLELVANFNGRPVGIVEYSLADGVVSIKNIEVREDLKRQGIGTQLYEQLKKENPGLPIETGGTTNEGTEFFKSLGINSEETQEEAPKIEKASTVATPDGIGEVKEIRNGKALVEIDGKIRQVPEDELIQSPLPAKDLADLYEDVLKGVEEERGEELSRMVNFAGYDPKTNTLAFLPHTGALYTYEEISPEDVALLTDILSTRKTSGENFIGAWKEGTKSPIGAAMSKLIQKLQKEAGGKGKEYSHKFETVYSALEPAVLALKKKKKKKK